MPKIQLAESLRALPRILSRRSRRRDSNSSETSSSSSSKDEPRVPDEGEAENPDTKKTCVNTETAGGKFSCGVGKLSVVAWRRRREAVETLRIAQLRAKSLMTAERDTTIRPDTRYLRRTREGTLLMEALEHTCHLIGMLLDEREYRNDFTANYRSLFIKEGKTRLFRLDLLHAAQEEIGAIWVNGDRYAFPTETLAAGRKLATKWSYLTEWFSASIIPSKTVSCSRSQETIEEFQDLMTPVDQAWVIFEELYVKRLIFIESCAKQILVKAVRMEESLTAADLNDPTSIHEARGKLVEVINRLNSVGNNEGKGRSDLGVEILQLAEKPLELDVELNCLARDICTSFHDIRAYFRSVSTSLDLMEPHMAHNIQLAQRLLCWEESWEIGKKFLVDENMRVALVSLVRHVREVCSDGMNDFEEKLAMCDADALWAVAKLVILQFVSSPTSDGLCREFLPECWKNDESLLSLMHQYKRLPASAHVHLYRCATGCEEPNALVEFFWKEIEAVATRLQRRHPTQWNRFVMVFLRCYDISSETEDE